VYKLRFLGIALAAGIVLAGGHSHAAQSSKPVKPAHPVPAHQAHHVTEAKPAGPGGWNRYVQQPDHHITAAPGVKDTTHM
jgi:hypothetical protein